MIRPYHTAPRGILDIAKPLQQIMRVLFNLISTMFKAEGRQISNDKKLSIAIIMMMIHSEFRN